MLLCLVDFLINLCFTGNNFVEILTGMVISILSFRGMNNSCMLEEVQVRNAVSSTD